jgi:hypothetical protein
MALATDHRHGKASNGILEELNMANAKQIVYGEETLPRLHAPRSRTLGPLLRCYSPPRHRSASTRRRRRRLRQDPREAWAEGCTQRRPTLVSCRQAWVSNVPLLPGAVQALVRGLERETPELCAESHLRIGERDIQEYLARQHPREKAFGHKSEVAFTLNACHTRAFPAPEKPVTGPRT